MRTYNKTIHGCIVTGWKDLGLGVWFIEVKRGGKVYKTSYICKNLTLKFSMNDAARMADKYNWV